MVFEVINFQIVPVANGANPCNVASKMPHI